MAAFHSNDVPSLQSLAFEAFFKEVLIKATPDTVEFVRDSIDQHFIGRVKKNVR